MKSDSSKYLVTVSAVIYADNQGHALTMMEERIKANGLKEMYPAYVIESKVQAAKDGQ